MLWIPFAHNCTRIISRPPHVRIVSWTPYFAALCPCYAAMWERITAGQFSPFQRLYLWLCSYVPRIMYRFLFSAWVAFLIEVIQFSKNNSPANFSYSGGKFQINETRRRKFTLVNRSENQFCAALRRCLQTNVNFFSFRMKFSRNLLQVPPPLCGAAVLVAIIYHR